MVASMVVRMVAETVALMDALMADSMVQLMAITTVGTKDAPRAALKEVPSVQ